MESIIKSILVKNAPFLSSLQKACFSLHDSLLGRRFICDTFRKWMKRSNSYLNKEKKKKRKDYILKIGRSSAARTFQRLFWCGTNCCYYSVIVISEGWSFRN